jgi:hypothetical protein
VSKAPSDEGGSAWRFSGIARAYVFLAAFLTGTGWILSACQKLNWTGGLFFAGLTAAIWIARRQYADWRALGIELVTPFKSPLVVVLSGLILASAVLYPPTMLDSLTYRLPRVLLWLEHGGVFHIASAEPRLNYLGQVWEFCTAPILVLAGVRWSWLWSFLSWLICQSVFYRWGLRLGQNPARSRKFALLANTSNFAVLQASATSNDLVAATLLLLALDFVWEYELHRQPGSINWAALSLALCTGVKPHFAVMGLPFLLWFLLARSRPWQAYNWRWIPLLFPLFLLCSAATTFAFNHATYGRITGPGQEAIYQRTGLGMNVMTGTTMMVWQALQPSINPAALVLNETLERAVVNSDIRSYCPRFTLHLVPVCITDGASMGLVTSILFLGGCWVGWRREKPGLWSFPVLALLAGGFGFVAAVSQFLPGSVGRSFLGFWLLGLPLALTGWRHFSDRTINISLGLALGLAILAVAFNPARPLWPARAIGEILAQRGNSSLVQLLDSYLAFQERAEAGRSLADRVPDGEPFFVALVSEDRPLLPILTSRHGPGAVRLLRSKATVAELLELGPRYVLVCDAQGQDYAELAEFLASGKLYRVLASAEYVSKIRRGNETWTLYAPVAEPGATGDRRP